jgi:hypothetical protein
VTHETGHVYLISPKVPFFTAQKQCMNFEEIIWTGEKKANIADAKYYKN